MANLYNTKLVCTSNSKLLQKIDPDEIIKEPNSEFLYFENGAYYFTTRDGTMHESIVALSKKYLAEIFIAQFWNVEFYDSEIQTFKYIDGYSKCTKVEPNYGYCISHIEKIIGKKTVRRFMKVALKQIRRIDAINDIPTAKNNRMERKHKISSSITINVEDEEFKIEATKIGSSFIEVNGFIKEAPTPRWQLIEKEKNQIVRVVYPLDKSIDETKDEEFADVPF